MCSLYEYIAINAVITGVEWVKIAVESHGGNDVTNHQRLNRLFKPVVGAGGLKEPKFMYSWRF